MYETSKAIMRRLHDSRFATRYFVGNGIDIGSGSDPLSRYAELFPLILSCRDWDLQDGDAQIIETVPDESMDFVHSSHCLEHMRDPHEALQNWLRILKPGGHLVVTIPDEDLYEQGVFPSTWNIDHKWTFTIHKQMSWSGKSVNIISLLMDFSDTTQIIKIEQLDATYSFSEQYRSDQTLTPLGESAVEIIMRKRTVVERSLFGRLPAAAFGEESLVSLSAAIQAAMQQHNEGQFSDALATYRRILMVKPDSAEIYKNFGDTLRAMGTRMEAKQAYEQAILINPGYGEAYNNLGILFGSDGRFEDAKGAFLKAIAIMPESAEVYNNYGNVMMELGESEEAEKLFRKALVLMPDFTLAYYNRSRALRILGRIEAAEKSLKKALMLDPSLTGSDTA